MKDLDNEEYDVVIVGAGLGALLAGAKFSKEGKHVLIIEQHSFVGGYATSFKRGRFVFEAGLHEIDSIFDNQNPNLHFLRELGILDNIKFLPVPEFYTVVRDNFEFILADNVELSRKALDKQFPKYIKEIDSFMVLMRKLRLQALSFPSTKGKMLLALPLIPFKFRSLFKYLFATLGNVIEKYFDDEDLKIVLTANTGYFHHDPKEYSMLHYGGAQGSYLIGGGSYIQGGSQALSNYLADFIRSYNGTILTNTKAEKIIITNKKVAAVRYIKKGSHKSVTTKTNFVLANCSIPSVMQNMIEGNVPQKIIKKYSHYEISHSIFAVYFGLKKPAQSIGIKSYSIFMLPSELTKFKDMGIYNVTNDFNKKIMAIVNYDMIHSALGEDDNYTVTCNVIDFAKNWRNLDKNAYNKRKEEMANILTKRINDRYPGFADLIEVRVIATPLTMERYTGNPDGAIYGYCQIPSQVGPGRPQWYSGIPGLYYASAWTKPGGGMTAAAKSGYVAATIMLKKMR